MNKFKKGDIVKTRSGIGKVVYVTNEFPLPYLVHIDGFNGHNGNGFKMIQDNDNNWWFHENHLDRKSVV